MKNKEELKEVKAKVEVFVERGLFAKKEVERHVPLDLPHFLYYTDHQNDRYLEFLEGVLHRMYEVAPVDENDTEAKYHKEIIDWIMEEIVEYNNYEPTHKTINMKATTIRTRCKGINHIIEYYISDDRMDDELEDRDPLIVMVSIMDRTGDKPKYVLFKDLTEEQHAVIEEGIVEDLTFNTQVYPMNQGFAVYDRTKEVLDNPDVIW